MVERFRLDEVENQLEKFASVLFENKDIVEIRALKGGRSFWVPAEELPDMASELMTLNENKQNIYCGANPRKRRKCKTNEGVALSRVLFADFDGGIDRDEALDRVERNGLPIPSLMLFSGHGIHAYWRSDEPMIDFNERRENMLRIAKAVGSDNRVHDAARIMRLPGFINWKEPGKPVLAKLIYSNPMTSYPITSLLFIFSNQPGEILNPCNTDNPADTDNTDPTDNSDNSGKCMQGVTTFREVFDFNSASKTTQEAILAAIQKSVPKTKGKRNEHIFKYARSLKAITDLASLTTGQLKPLVKLWHQEALSTIGTKDFDETWVDFVHAWAKVKYPEGDGMIEKALKDGKANPPPRYEQYGALRDLYCLTGELQRRSGEKPFFLACRPAANILGVDPGTINRRIHALLAEQVLVEVEKGSMKSKKASTFRFLDPLN